MVVYIDIDETICTHKNEDPSVPRDYADAMPIAENIAKANEMYDTGATIVYWTARGTVTGIDWTEVTKKQLKDWGCRYHEVKLGKPYYDIFIDDKAMNVKDWK